MWLLEVILGDTSALSLSLRPPVSSRLYDVAGAVVCQRRQRTLMYYVRILPASFDNDLLEWMVDNMPLLHASQLDLDLDILGE